ncbi:DUF1350 domain containing protein [Nitzschia inconspicua]|uniref:DUF1350 domain containing protein n=1 Tax=Nitzschia inconspicua TaxID=303405 RepID=A0A9K3QAB3_9STRA|nr:DUF1350 domain containing protein [Nitzschia inconspicua]
MHRRQTRLIVLALLEYVATISLFLPESLISVQLAVAFSTLSPRRPRKTLDGTLLVKQPILKRPLRRLRRTETRLNVVTDFTAKDSSSSSSPSSPKGSTRRPITNKNNIVKTSTGNAKTTNTNASTVVPPTPTNTFFAPSSSIDSSPSTSDNLVTGVVGNWESLHGNWVLRPYGGGSMDEPPRAVIHFLGGALVGAAPQITYRYLLEKLADKGFLIVATPYNLSFDHLATCDEILTKFENLAPTLARQYGALPVVGIGHSCGALLHLLITCLFPDTPRAANALISFNNKPVSEAVPFFEEFFAPFFTSIAAPTMMDTESGTKAEGPSSNDSLVIGLKLAMAATQGQLPSDELLQEAQRVFTPTLPPPLGFLLPNVPAPPFFPFNNNQKIQIPTEIREAYSQWAAPSVSQLNDAGVLSLIHETIVSLEQIPKLVEEVAEGARDFNPTPALVRSAAGKAYRARRTLILGYQDDPIDESDEVEEVLREALSITRMRRPMVEIDVQRKTLMGGHEAPLVAPPLDVAERAEDLLGPESSQDVLGYRSAAATADDLVRWLEEGNL